MKPLSETARIFRLREVARAHLDAAEARFRARLDTHTEAVWREARCKALRQEVRASGLKVASIASEAGIQKPNFHSLLTGMRPVTAARLEAVRAAIAKLTAQ